MNIIVYLKATHMHLQIYIYNLLEYKQKHLVPFYIYLFTTYGNFLEQLI